jgi:signal transduction histidine kinase
VKFSAEGECPLFSAPFSRLKAAVRSCQGAVQQKRLELRTDFAADSTSMLGDSSRLRQLFWNPLRL